MNRRTFLGRTVTTVGLVGLAGCTGPQDGGGNGGDGGMNGNGQETEFPSPSPTQTPTETPTDGGGTEVAMVTDGGEYYFDPIGLHVESGDTVTWILESGSHSSTAYHESIDAAETTRIPDGAEPWNSEILSEQGATFEHTFETEGTYDYFCIPHKQLGMVGRIVVGQPGGPAEGSMPPDGKVPESSTIVEQGQVSYDEFTG